MRVKGFAIYAMVMVVAWAFAVTAKAGPVELYVDSAPNVYGSPNWGPWWADTKQDVVDGSFTNMRTGTYPGTNHVDPLDFIVYSDGDLGKRVHWVYFLEGETVAGLADRFQVKTSLDWDGVDYTYDGGWLADGPEAGWITPGSWEDYDDGTTQGVIGSFGWAFWATVGMSGAGDLADEIFAYETYLKGHVRYRETINSDWQNTDINLILVPLPSSLLMGLAGLAVVLVCGWRRLPGIC